MKSYYSITLNNLNPPDSHSSEWPKVIGYSFAHGKFLFIEGNGHGITGAEIDQHSPCLSKWQDLFVTLDSEWFLDFLKLNTFSDENDFLSRLTAISGQPEIINY
ncbi:hypothetical protein [Aquipseudomonas alcaligenes]|uniref:hypothetical protein n=1 Tax=Aquipseudomonas alcaligenes TaxID=43263 RepID=UPI00077FF82D|nr:hypothetical protein [Pseudomonas alcaligenes]AMR65118.1 hypothetical protein A0T30_01570 [Pseudomonas alcaligenes]